MLGLDPSDQAKELEKIVNRSPAVAFLWRTEEGWPVDFVTDNVNQFGYTPEDFYSRKINYSTLVHPGDMEWAKGEYERYSRQEGIESFKLEYRILTKDGDVRWVDDRTWVRREADGSVTHHQGIIVDITERKKAEIELQRKLELENVISSITGSGINLDPEMMDWGINKGLHAIGDFFKVDRCYIFQFYENGTRFKNTHEWCAKGIEPQIHNLQGMDVDPYSWTLNKIKKQQVIHIPVVADLPEEASAEKEEFEREGVKSLILIPMVSKGEAIGFFGIDSVKRERSWKNESLSVLKFITEIFTSMIDRKKIETELRINEEKFRLAFENSVNAIIWAEPDTGILINCNKAAEKLLEKTRDEIVGHHMTTIHPPEEKEKYLMIYLDDKKEVETSKEMEIITKSGKRKNVFIQSSFTKIGDTVIKQGEFIDVTETVRAQKQVQYHHDLEKLITEISTNFINIDPDQLNQGIHDALCAIGEFTNSDRSYVLLFTEENVEISSVFEWCTDDVESQTQHLMNLELDTIPWLKNSLEQLKIINIASIDDLPEEAYMLRSRLKNEGIKSIILLPMVASGKPFGCLGFVSIHKEKIWRKDEITLLTIVGEVFVNALERRKKEEQLRESEARFRTAIESLPFDFYILDEDEHCVMQNSVSNKSWGDVIGKKPQDVAPDEETLRLWSENNKRAFSGEIVEGEVAFKIDGKDRFFYNIISPIYAGEERRGILGVNIDITNIKEAEQKLKDSEEKYRMLVETSRDIIALINIDGRPQFINQAGIDIFGYTREEIMAMKDWGPIHEEDIPKLEKALAPLVMGKNVKNVEYRYKTKDGAYLYLQTSYSPILNKNGALVSFLSVSRDITEQKEIEKKLIKSEEKYRLISENANDMISIISADGKYTYVNENAFKKILGYDREDLMGKTPFDIVHPDDLQVALKGLKTIFNKKKSSAQCRFRKKDSGEYVWFEGTGSLFTDESGEQKILAISRDITERKRIEELLEKENLRLKELDELRKEFVSNATHELKTPLVSIYGASKFLLDNFKDQMKEEVLNLIEFISRGSTRLKRLIENLLDFSRLEIGKFHLDMRNLDLVKIVESAIDETLYLVNQREQVLVKNLPDALEINVDEVRVEQVLSNLLSNAIKNTPYNGRIKVSLEEKQDEVIISVEDNGVGLTESEKGKLFKKFEKIDRGEMNIQTDIQGSGLGLYLSKEIVEKHGGRIWVESEGRGKGAKFSFSLPK
ncbi:MAG: PAS domain S-box protein [Candidatus Hodarchaeota archaeon]